MDPFYRVVFIVVLALCAFLVISVDQSAIVSEAQTNTASVVGALQTGTTSVAQASTTTPASTPITQPASTQVPSTQVPTYPNPPAPTQPTLPAPVTQPSGGSNSPAPSTSLPTPAPAQPARTVVAWLQANDWAAGVASVSKNASVIKEASPAWYQVEADGSVSARKNSFVDDGALVSTVKAKGIALRPLVMSVPGAGAGATALVKIFKDDTLRAKHVAALTDLAVKKGYDGLDVDYESIPVKDLPHLATFIEDLGAALHAKGKTLAVSIDTQPAQSVLASWARIGKAADNVRLMAYGIPYNTPSAVVDLTWMEARLTHALKVIPKEKLSLGIPLYCNKWSAGGRGSASWAKLNKENSVSVACGDAKLVAKETAIAKRLGVTSYAFWRLGGEDPAVWQAISQ